MSVLTLAEAKMALDSAPDADEAKIQITLEAAEAAIGAVCGPLGPTTVTTRVQGNTRELMLPVTPAVSLTSVTPVGSTALTVGDLMVNTSGIVSYINGGSFGSGWYDVVYVAGRATLTSDLKLAVWKLTDHLWRTQRDPTLIPALAQAGGEGLTTIPLSGAAYAFPPRVTQLIQPYLQVGF